MLVAFKDVTIVKPEKKEKAFSVRVKSRERDSTRIPNTCPSWQRMNRGTVLSWSNGTLVLCLIFEVVGIGIGPNSAVYFS
jgi:hypothetical protein